jgi:hypothetical protein
MEAAMKLLNKISNWRTPDKLLLLLLLAFLLVGGPVIASSGGPFDLSWWTVDGGGGGSSGGSYALNGTIGQADASTALSGDSYELSGGFWAGVSGGSWSVYLPTIVR